MSLSEARTTRRRASDSRRDGIIAAARRVFEAEGLEGASLRAIAAEAGYTPAALYFHFASREALYAEVLQGSIAKLKAFVAAAAARQDEPAARLSAAALGFFDFYTENPRELDLGFYLFKGGMRPKGVGRERDRILNAALADALAPIAEAAASLGAHAGATRLAVADLFAHATGLLLLHHTGRIRMFGASARAMMAGHAARIADDIRGERS